MGINNLNSYEKDILLSLSYLDIPKNMASTKMSMKELIDAMADLEKNRVGQKTRYDKVKEYLEKNPNSPLHKLTLVDYENHNTTYKDGSNNNTGESESGLVAYAFKDGNNNGVVLYRGSELDGKMNSILDWGSNVVAGLGITITQQKEALEFYDKNKGAFNETTLMGHSKGGNLTSYVYLKRLKDNLKAYVMNGQPINWWALTYEQREALKSENFTFNVINGDFVSELGYVPYIDKIIKFKEGAYDGFIDPHQEYNAQYDQNGEHIKEDKPYDEFWGQKALGVTLKYLLQAINSNSYISKFNKRVAYASLIMDKSTYIIINACTKYKAISESVINSLSEGLAKLVGAGTDFSNKLNEFFKKIQTVTLNAIKKGKDYICKSIFTSERIVVNTQSLANYEQQLREISRRIAVVNDRIDNLYLKVGLLGIDNILRADIMTNGTWKMNKMISAMRTTREILERNERNLVIKAQNI